MLDNRLLHLAYLALPTLAIASPAAAAPAGTVPTPAVDAPIAVTAAPSVLYLNRTGGTFMPGHTNDSRDNVSIIPDGPSQIAPWDVSTDEWAAVVECVRGQFARWDIEVTDQAPGTTGHFEAVIGGRSQDIGLPPGIGGVSPFRSDCSVIDNSIVFVFADVYGDAHRAVCETVAQEVGHSLGLDHAFLCEDPMTYLGGCGAKSFQDEWAPCGEDSERPCACGGATQNSVDLLDVRLGVFGGPRFELASPRDGARVPPGFNVAGRALDDDGLESISLLVNGNHIADADTDEFLFETPMLAAGKHTLELVGIDSTGTTGRRQLTVTVDPNAKDPTDITPELPPLACNAGGSAPGPSALLVGLAVLALFWRRRLS